jgi:hypothetical protein
MISYLLYGNSILRVGLQKAFYHALAFICQRDFLGELELVVSNPPVSVVHCVSFKRGLPDDKGVKNNSNCPNVDLVGMTGLVQNFRGDVVGSSTGREPSLALALEFG